MPSAHDVLACPHCRGELEWTATTAACTGCARRYVVRDGITDFAPDLVERASFSQRLMESRVVVAGYERYVRPLLTHLVSPFSYADEEAFLTSWSGSSANALVLDLSCGTGRYARWLATRVGASRVVGLDLSAPMLRRCRHENAALGLDEITLVRGTALSLPVTDGALDALNCFGALHLYPDPALALREVGRVLGPAGRFTCLTTALGEGRRDRAWGELMRRTGVRPFRLVDLERDVRAAGLELLEVRHAGKMVLIAAERA